MAALPPITVQPLRSARLDLEPLRVDHAAEATVVFDDDRLHRYMGSAPAGEEELRQVARALGFTPPAMVVDGEIRWVDGEPRRPRSGAVVSPRTNSPSAVPAPLQELLAKNSIRKLLPAELSRLQSTVMTPAASVTTELITGQFCRPFAPASPSRPTGVKRPVGWIEV